MAKISISKVMDDVVHIQNQINGLTMLLSDRKAILVRYFDKTGERQVANDECIAYVQERTSVDYDIDALKDALPEEVFSDVIVTERKAKDWKKIARFLKSKGFTKDDFRDFKKMFEVTQKVDQQKLSKYYETGEVDIKNLKGCYTASVKKSIALRMKNTDSEIPIKEK